MPTRAPRAVVSPRTTPREQGAGGLVLPVVVAALVALIAVVSQYRPGGRQGGDVAYLAQGDLPSSQLSPGDFDEALTTIVASSFSDDGHRLDRGGAFERTKSLRTGVFDGLPGCL
ncbi:hypothetical protein AB0F43_25855 [Kribbella sp. NPDC023972]|uniref:hypothetical protein n=1 Tax=Kribbella sp. NPDC023972 TaxID=3154795 RepID=UPI0033F1828B